MKAKIKAKWLRVLAQEVNEDDLINSGDWVVCGGFTVEIKPIKITIVAAPTVFIVWLGNNLLIKRGVEWQPR